MKTILKENKSELPIHYKKMNAKEHFRKIFYETYTRPAEKISLSVLNHVFGKQIKYFIQNICIIELFIRSVASNEKCQ